MSNPVFARRTAVEIAFGGVNITSSILPYLLSLTYTDNETDEADDLQLRLQDRDGIWAEKWLVDIVRNVTPLNMEAVIVRKNWLGDGKDVILPCGNFEADSIVLSGPPDVITIKGTSLPFSSPIRQTLLSRAWENITLSALVAQIAAENGMRCMFESAYDPFYPRVEQAGVSNMEFLSRLCHNAGISLKATNKIIVLFDQATYEGKSPVFIIRKSKTGYLKYKMDLKSVDSQYSSCRVRYIDPATGNCIEGIASNPGKSKQQLEINAKVANRAEAEALAAKHLRLHNKQSKSVTFTLPGDPALVSGLTIDLADWGAFDGRYIISQAVHTVGASGYTTQVKARWALEGI